MHLSDIIAWFIISNLYSIYQFEEPTNAMGSLSNNIAPGTNDQAYKNSVHNYGILFSVMLFMKN